MSSNTKTRLLNDLEALRHQLTELEAYGLEENASPSEEGIPTLKTDDIPLLGDAVPADREEAITAHREAMAQLGAELEELDETHSNQSAENTATTSTSSDNGHFELGGLDDDDPLSPPPNLGSSTQPESLILEIPDTPLDDDSSIETLFDEAPLELDESELDTAESQDPEPEIIEPESLHIETSESQEPEPTPTEQHQPPRQDPPIDTLVAEKGPATSDPDTLIADDLPAFLKAENLMINTPIPEQLQVQVSAEDNPFLPQHLRERLSKSKSSLLEGIARSSESLDASTALLRNFGGKPAESSITAQDHQALIDHLVLKYLPIIEADLRQRLHTSLNQSTTKSAFTPESST